MSDSMGSNLARGKIFTTSIGSVDLLYTGRIVVCKNCNILSKLKALKRDSIYNMVCCSKKSGIYLHLRSGIYIHDKSVDIHIC